MQDDLPPLVIHLDRRITPTEVRIQVFKPDRHLNRGDGGGKPCMIYKHHKTWPYSLGLACEAQKSQGCPGPIHAIFYRRSDQGLFDTLGLRAHQQGRSDQ